MKKFKLKRILLSLFIVALILSMSILPVTSQFKYDYEAPIPLGVGIDLVVGLSEDEVAKATDNYYENSATEYGKLHNIEYNFLQSIDKDKYYAGSYWEGDPFIYDENGKKLRDDNGKPIMNYDVMEMHVTVTDIKIVPKEMDNSRIIFHEVKYSETDLKNFMDIIDKNFSREGLVGMGIDVRANKLEIHFLEGIDVNKIKGLIPYDSYYVVFVEGYAETVASTSVLNGGLVSVVDSSGTTHEGSIGFPVYWGNIANRSKGWLTAGHVITADNRTAKYSSSGSTIGTTSNFNIGGNYDAGTILRGDNTSYVSSPYGPYGVSIAYQEGSAYDFVGLDKYVNYKGANSGNGGGQIKSMTWSQAINGITVYNLVRVEIDGGDYIKKGDSGGPVTWTYSDGFDMAVGIITAKYTIGSTEYMIYSRLKYIREGINGLDVGAFS